MADHRYKLGQIVSVTQHLPDRPRTGRAEIIRLLPASVDGEFDCRIRGADKVERAVGERYLSTS